MIVEHTSQSSSSKSLLPPSPLHLLRSFPFSPPPAPSSRDRPTPSPPRPWPVAATADTDALLLPLATPAPPPLFSSARPCLPVIDPLAAAPWPQLLPTQTPSSSSPPPDLALASLEEEDPRSSSPSPPSPSFSPRRPCLPLHLLALNPASSTVAKAVKPERRPTED
ncbi:proline-rich receptor-like protein kinase PERK2 [Syzygium oleosum]|uniref:proline-rich receptor-like protein kinase PERK2 n=1 Tax=Syzygium oleosum TaxID=219896 RepID=UPI0024B9A70F|nr:proline-rich receptor-like protein kinase PERK2 [Syzygium oleosum]